MYSATYPITTAPSSTRSTTTNTASKRAKMPPVEEAAIQNSIEAISTGQDASIRVAATLYDVPRTTLSDRINNKPTRTKTRQSQLLLSLKQEQALHK
jgi:helix-turn-helix, Psq domain